MGVLEGCGWPALCSRVMRKCLFQGEIWTLEFRSRLGWPTLTAHDAKENLPSDSHGPTLARTFRLCPQGSRTEASERQLALSAIVFLTLAVLFKVIITGLHALPRNGLEGK